MLLATAKLQPFVPGSRSSVKAWGAGPPAESLAAQPVANNHNNHNNKNNKNNKNNNNNRKNSHNSSNNSKNSNNNSKNKNKSFAPVASSSLLLGALCSGCRSGRKRRCSSGCGGSGWPCGWQVQRGCAASALPLSASSGNSSNNNSSNNNNNSNNSNSNNNNNSNSNSSSNSSSNSNNNNSNSNSSSNSSSNSNNNSSNNNSTSNNSNSSSNNNSNNSNNNSNSNKSNSSNLQSIPQHPQFSSSSSSRRLFPKQSELATLQRQDELFLQHVERYGPTWGSSCSSEGYRALVLQALRTSDLPWLFREVREGLPGDWDFIFPPAGDEPGAGARQEHEHKEAWCRSPLSLLLRPSEGFFATQFLTGVPRDARLQLVREALQRRVCSPHFEGQYWSCPAIHAALVGDVQALTELHAAGLDMQEVLVEFDSDRPSFTVVHAAAINGHVEALQWLADTFDSLDWLDQEDASGRTAIYHAVQTARSAAAARLLVAKGCDAFHWTPSFGRSPFSLAIEVMPELAEELLMLKSTTVYAWLGSPAVRLDFEGIAVHPQVDCQLRFASQSSSFSSSEEGGESQRGSVESLVARSRRPEMASTPVLAQLSERKWFAFARNRYWALLATFAAAALPFLLEATVGVGLDRDVQLPLLLLSLISWAAYLRAKVLQCSTRGLASFIELSWNVMDSIVLLLLPFGLLGHANSIWGSTSDLGLFFLPPGLPQTISAVVDALLSLLMSARLLRYLSVFSILRIGSYLNSMLQVLASAWQPLLFLSLVISSFALAFLILFRIGMKEEDVAGSAPTGYFQIFFLLIKWLFDPSSAFKTLGSMKAEGAGYLFLLLYYCSAVLGSLRFLTDSGQKSRETSAENANRQWLDVRARVVDDIEEQMISGSPGDQEELRRFYAELREGGELVPLDRWRQGS